MLQPLHAVWLCTEILIVTHAPKDVLSLSISHPASEHSLYRYLMGQHSRHWGWLIFFSIQGPIVAIENVIKRQLKQNRIQLPWLLRVAMTIAALLTVADKYFFPPVVGSGLADHVVELMKQNVEGVVSLMTRTGHAAL